MADDFMGFGVSRLYVVPQDPKEREFILSVDRKTKGDIAARYDLNIDQDFICNTVTFCVLESIIKSLALNSQLENLSSMFNFYDLIIAKISNKINEFAEKEGNINIAFMAGSKAMKLISNPEEEDNERRDIAEELSFDDPTLTELYISLDRFVKYQLSQQYGITMSEKLVLCTFAIAYTFIENLYKNLLYNLANNEEDELCSLNYGDIIEFHALEKEDGVTFALRAGYKSKLLVKSDEVTEEV